ncbi:ABC transporter ATP-binding protein [Campylobacter sp. Marseille-Q3452]|uniref:ABC transporter ATP-binding protein n=1 Tax=Campylobacter massiliensis TaxID=2762557 RepID=A0A842J4I8_9BACT|nr:ABC transporter ATP-binding protein [Campylobacter massiliensis]MBC2881700.1 ABC transporter ATP-binding protein [Campylobacter massiliensis]
MNAQNISAQIRRLNLDEISLGQNLNARGDKIYGIDKAPSPTERKSNLSGSNLANKVKAKFSLHKNFRVNFSSANLPSNLTNASNLTASQSSNLTPNSSPKQQSDDYAIDVRGLTKKFGKKIITDGVDIRVKKGSVCGFLGPNGSGKTTTIRMLCGLLKPDGGSGSCLGYEFRGQSEAIRLKTGYMTQKFGWYDDLSVKENLEFIARLFAVKNQKAAVNQILDRLDLAPRQNHLAGSLSGGWKQRLALAMCLVHGPELLLLDEPTAGVDPKARREFWDIIHGLAQDGITVLVSTHYMDEAERCHELIYIAYGKILARGTQADIIAGYDLNVWQLSGDRAGEAASLLGSNAALSVSAFGNGYHVTAKDEAALQDAVKGLAIPQDELSLIPIKASLEDVFIHLLELYKDERF